MAASKAADSRRQPLRELPPANGQDSGTGALAFSELLKRARAKAAGGGAGRNINTFQTTVEDPPIPAKKPSWREELQPDDPNHALFLSLLSKGFNDNNAVVNFLDFGVDVKTFEDFYPHLGRQGYFKNYMNLTNTLGMVKKEENLSKSAATSQVTGTKLDTDTLEANVERARQTVPFKDFPEEKFYKDFHPRILYRLNTTPVNELFVATAMLPAETRIPTYDYDFRHLAGLEVQITPKGWLYAHRPDLPGFDIAYFAPIDMAAVKRDDTTGLILWEDSANAPTLANLNSLQHAVSNHGMSRRRAAPSDFSLEPIQKHLLNKNWYLYLPVERCHLSPTDFCVRGYNFCMMKLQYRYAS